MALYRIKDFDPDYRTYFNDDDIVGYDLYSGDDKVGTVDDLLVDESGSFRYLVVHTGAWIFGKKVLLPIGRSRLSHSDRRVYVDGLSKDQINNLPEYNGSESLDYDYEEQVRGVYRPMEMSPGAAPLDNTATAGSTAAYDRNNYTYDRDPALYGMRDRDHQNLRLYEERLIANKTRQKTGEVIVGKRVETEHAKASIPIEKERVIVERTTPTGQAAVKPGEATFSEGQVARMEIYEEVPDIHKEAFVREEVKVRKEVDQQTVDADENIRRERLDIKTEGNPRVDKRPDDRV